MVKFSSVLFALLSLLVVPTAEAEGYFETRYRPIDSGYYGQHLWDVRRHATTRNYGQRYSTNYTDLYYYQHPDRTQTHALHPMYRHNYYEGPVSFELARERRRHRVPYSPLTAYVPEAAPMAGCRNYTYAQPNYRVPPFEFECLR
jgi:hypothetical protein